MIRIFTFLFLASSFLLWVGSENEYVRSVYLVSVLNSETILCNHISLINYEIDQVYDSKYKECAFKAQVIGWIFLIPITAFQVYMLRCLIRIRYQINQMDRKTEIKIDLKLEETLVN